MQWAKDILKRTLIYDLVQQHRARKALAQAAAVTRRHLQFYSQFVSPGCLCFDVGANVGARVKIFLELGAKVVAVEPQDQCVAILRADHGVNQCLVIVQTALGAAEGEIEMMISNASTISSLSPEWVAAVKASGRFSEYNWDLKKVVPVTTLDRLIAQHGVPAFIKIDVEGYEYTVLKGLSQPVNALSLEFTPEFIDSTFQCIEHLRRLGDIRLNYSTGETMQLALEKWVMVDEMTGILSRFQNDNTLFGDVYVRFQK